MSINQYPAWAGTLANHYWHLRNIRPHETARHRYEYRRIYAEKKRLQGEGVDSEVIRLLCRHLINNRNKKAEERWWKAYAEYLENTRQGVLKFE